MKVGSEERVAGRSDMSVLAAQFVALFPELEPDSSHVALTVYRLLGEGDAVPAEAVSTACGVDVKRVEKLLDEWPGVYREDGKVVGFWGLTTRKFSNHRFQVGGRTLYTWCAWDALFLPGILGKAAEVISEDPQTGETIRLTVTPEGVQGVVPAATVLSMVQPRSGMVEDLVARLCHYIHFFASPASGSVWISGHPNTNLLTLDEAFDLGRRTNQARYGDAPRQPWRR